MILPLTSQSYPRDFAAVATMLMGIHVFQNMEEELMKLTTNTQQLTTNNYGIGESYYANLLEH